MVMLVWSNPYEAFRYWQVPHPTIGHTVSYPPGPTRVSPLILNPQKLMDSLPLQLVTLCPELPLNITYLKECNPVVQSHSHVTLYIETFIDIVNIDYSWKSYKNTMLMFPLRIKTNAAHSINIPGRKQQKVFYYASHPIKLVVATDSPNASKAT